MYTGLSSRKRATTSGTSLTVTYGFGIAQAAAIFGVFYALARQWLTPLVAGLSTAVLLAIGFSGDTFNFILPHTNSGTFAILTLLLMLLAMRKRRLKWAGVALGLVALTRPEFIAVAAGAAVAYVVAAWLAGIVVNLLTASGFYDVALRDFGLMLAALTLARLASVYDRPWHRRAGAAG